jgi:hypothetical protein
MSDASHTLPDRWIVPWTDEQANVLNEIQKNLRLHGYTCPGEMATCKDKRLLIATPAGWICRCGAYRQDWAHAVPEGIINAIRAAAVRDDGLRAKGGENAS